MFLFNVPQNWQCIARVWGGGGEKKRMLLSHRKQCTVVVERMPVDHFPIALHLRGSDRSVPGARSLSQ